MEHRIEFVREHRSPDIITIPRVPIRMQPSRHSRAMPGPTLLIAGGYDKTANTMSGYPRFEGKVRYLVLIGQTRDKIAECAKKHGLLKSCTQKICGRQCGYAPYMRTSEIMYLLSPACAKLGYV